MIDAFEIPPMSFTQKISAVFIGGGIAGFASGTLIGLSRTLNEFPLIRLNSVLNPATRHGSIVGYNCGMVTSLFAGSALAAERLHFRPPGLMQQPLGLSAFSVGPIGA
jgi:hypothetical protein